MFQWRTRKLCGIFGPGGPLLEEGGGGGGGGGVPIFVWHLVRVAGLHEAAGLILRGLET